MLSPLSTDFARRAADDPGFAITRKWLLAGGIGLVVAVTIGVVALQSVRREDKVQIMAHRGASKAAPENTLAAIRKAIEDGADWVEIDVQETADGEVVVFHDSDFMKLARVNLKIWDATLDDLTDIDIGSSFAPEFKDERVPTFAQVLDACKGRIGVNIELKYYGHDQQLEQRVAEIVDSRGMQAEVVAMSLKMDGVRKMKSLRPQWKVGLLMSVSAGDLQQVEADFLAVNARFADRRMIRQAHDAGKEVYVWTVNDAVTMSTLIGRGVDGLLTDRPQLARSVLAPGAVERPRAIAAGTSRLPGSRPRDRRTVVVSGQGLRCGLRSDSPAPLGSGCRNDVLRIVANEKSAASARWTRFRSVMWNIWCQKRALPGLLVRGPRRIRTDCVLHASR